MDEIRLTKEHLKLLAAPFGPEAIKIKVQTKPNDNGNALCVAYIDARDVADRLDEVAGGDWWDEYHKAEAGGLECALTVMGITRHDVGSIDDSDNETEKSAYSDAFKRAAVKFGVGRFLYGLPKMYAKVKQYGKNYYLADGEEGRLATVIQNALSVGPSSANQRRPGVQAQQKPSNDNGHPPSEPDSKSTQTFEGPTAKIGKSQYPAEWGKLIAKGNVYGNGVTGFEVDGILQKLGLDDKTSAEHVLEAVKIWLNVKAEDGSEDARRLEVDKYLAAQKAA
jgi:hypothetical protein